MSPPLIVSCLLALFFFMGGCMQVGLHIATTPTEPLPPFLVGLLTAAWPLGVAGVIFILLDMRMQQGKTAARMSVEPPPNAPREPDHFPKAAAGKKAAPEPEASPAPMSFATPPPSPNAPMAQPQPPPVQKKPDPNDSLSYFKL